MATTKESNITGNDYILIYTGDGYPKDWASRNIYSDKKYNNFIVCADKVNWEILTFQTLEEAAKHVLGYSYLYGQGKYFDADLQQLIIELKEALISGRIINGGERFYERLGK